MRLKRTISQRFASQLALWLAGTPHGRQQQIAELCGISPSKLNNIIKGRRGSSEDLRREICKILGVDYDRFVFGRPGKEKTLLDDKDLHEFVELYRDYGSPSFLRQCIDKLKAIQWVVEEE